MSTRSIRAIVGLFGLSLVSSVASAQCVRWASGFDSYGGGGSVLALAVHDDGSGPALYVGGGEEIARLDGASWSVVGGGVEGDVRALLTFDDGSGPALYAAGNFIRIGDIAAENIARWDGTSWSPLGAGVSGGAVSALEVFDDGSGSALYVAGSFTSAGGAPAARIARWDGSSWTTVGSGFPNAVGALEVFDDGSGPALYAGGVFSVGIGGAGNFVARWNGASWSAVGHGTNGAVFSLVAHDDGSGPALYAGGSFTTAGSGTVYGLARWDGAGWLGMNLPGFPGMTVRELLVHDDGSGADLYAAGRFSDGTSGDRISRWDGSVWTEIGTGGAVNLQRVEALASFTDASGPTLFAGGTFSSMDGVEARSIARWNGSSWSSISAGNGIDGQIDAFATHDDGGGLALFAAGSFSTAGTISASRVARFDGTSWSPLSGQVFGGGFNALASFDDGGGSALFLGGTFFFEGGGFSGTIARWQNGVWSALSSGVNGTVYALKVFDDGSGPALYVGGRFTSAGGLPSPRIARWNGSAWSAVGSGLGFDGGFLAAVYALEIFDDGSGPALYAAGDFTSADGQPARSIARWDGVAWSNVGGGIAGGDVLALATFDDGSGPALYAGGAFTNAGGTAALRVARWNGTSWSSLAYPGPTTVQALGSFDDGSGPALYAGASGTIGIELLRWNGATWSSVQCGPGNVNAFATYPSGPGEPDALYTGGGFKTAGGLPSLGIARWERCPVAPVPFCFGDGSIGACPCANSGLAGHGCRNSANVDGALLSTSGTTFPDTLVLQVVSEPATASSVFLQGNAQLATPALFGDGLRCVGGALKRLYVASAVGGAVSAPSPSDPSITHQSAVLGDPISPGSTRWYQVYYRDSDLTFCPAPQGDAWNVSNGVQVVW